jgi:hypothetical protein
MAIFQQLVPSGGSRDPTCRDPLLVPRGELDLRIASGIGYEAPTRIGAKTCQAKTFVHPYFKGFEDKRARAFLAATSIVNPAAIRSR